MTKQETVEARRALLSAEIKSRGLSVVAKAAEKPDRQIKDMAMGRKSFGDGIAKEIGPRIRPDLPKQWLVYPEIVPGPLPVDPSSLEGVTLLKGPDLPVEGAFVIVPNSTEGDDWQSFADHLREPTKTITYIAKSQRDKDIEEIVSIARRLSDTGVGMLLGYSQKLLEDRPAKQTASSSE